MHTIICKLPWNYTIFLQFGFISMSEFIKLLSSIFLLQKKTVICWGFFLPAVFVRPRVADSIVQANNKDKIRCGLIPPNDLWLLWCQKKARLAKLLKWKNQNRHCSSVKSWTHTKEFSSLLQDAGTPHKCHPWADSRNAVLVHLADSKSAYNPKNFCCKN